MTQLNFGEPSLKLLKQNLGLILGSAEFVTHKRILDSLLEHGSLTSVSLNFVHREPSKVAVALTELRKTHLVEIVMGDGLISEWPVRLTKAAKERLERRLERVK